MTETSRKTIRAVALIYAAALACAFFGVIVEFARAFVSQRTRCNSMPSIQGVP